MSNIRSYFNRHFMFGASVKPECTEPEKSEEKYIYLNQIFDTSP
jgi:hypothetical protein